jgi:hypothetical protein
MKRHGNHEKSGLGMLRKGVFGDESRFTRVGGFTNIALPLVAMALFFIPVDSLAQGIRLSQREVQPPDYATFRLGPLYSTMALTETVGYRYTSSSGSGTDYISNNELGEILKDGGDFPIISTLSFRNYLIITRNIDLDASFRVGYEYYPQDTQEDEFLFDMTEEGIFGNISSAFRITEFLQGTIYDNFLYKTDYVDVRGEEDRYGGTQYERFENTVGLQLGWQASRKQRLSGGLSRYDVLPQDDEFADQERIEYREGIIYSYQVYEGLQVGGQIGFRQIEYTGTNRPNANLNSYSVFARASEGQALGLPVGPNTTLTVSLGVATGYGREKDDDEGEGANADAVSATGSVALETQMSPTLSQRISYDKGMTGGYSSAFEERDVYDYRLSWKGKLSSAQFFSTLTDVVPSLESENEYRAWSTGVDLAYPLTHYITLNGRTSYTIRENEGGLISEDEDLELSNDYNTWVTRIGTSFRLTKKLSFSAYAEHTDRTSDAEDLKYERDTLAAYLTYHHQF